MADAKGKGGELGGLFCFNVGFPISQVTRQRGAEVLFPLQNIYPRTHQPDIPYPYPHRLSSQLDLRRQGEDHPIHIREAKSPRPLSSRLRPRSVLGLRPLLRHCHRRWLRENRHHPRLGLPSLRCRTGHHFHRRREYDTPPQQDSRWTRSRLE